MSREEVRTEEYNGYVIKIFTDDDPENPRGESNLGIMACWHRRYNLGDEGADLNVRPEHFFKILAQQQGLPVPEDIGEFIDLDDNEAKEALENAGVVILPLYLYDHSGITMSTAPFGDRWDSGQVGWIYTTPEKMKEFGVDGKTKEEIEKSLCAEVEVYDKYLTGDVYGFRIYKKPEDPADEDEGEEVESCWGFYGEEECLDKAKSICR